MPFPFPRCDSKTTLVFLWIGMRTCLGTGGKSFTLPFSHQGRFPKGDKAEDGFHGVSPVNAFPAQNNYGKSSLGLMAMPTNWLLGPSCLERRQREAPPFPELAPGPQRVGGVVRGSQPGLTRRWGCRAL